MDQPRRFGAYLSARPDQSVYGEIAFAGRRVVLTIPKLKRPHRWGWGFVFHSGWFWLFQNQEAVCYKPKNP